MMARRARAGAVPVPGFSAEAILRAVNDRTRLVALCNPNDPTGGLMTSGELDGLLGALPERVVVLLDEALRDYATAEPLDAALALAERHPRLLVFRTFSKAWGLAGIRVGYAIGGPGAEPLLERLEPELGLSELAQAGALEALRSQAGLPARRAAAIAQQRERLTAELRGRGLDVAPSQANILWAAAPGASGAELAHRLERGGVRVASGGPLGDDARVRITVPHRPELAERLLRAVDLART
jgi:histidinol-phosphate aminotransferase